MLNIMLCNGYHFLKVYEPVEEGSYIKMIDMVSGNGGQIQVSDCSSFVYKVHTYTFHASFIGGHFKKSVMQAFVANTAFSIQGINSKVDFSQTNLS